jgi:RNA polymerase sigma factor (sigma-70 family)
MGQTYHYYKNIPHFLRKEWRLFRDCMEKWEDNMVAHTSDTSALPCDPTPANEEKMTISHAALLADMEQIFTEARPRLLRLACVNGLPPDIAEDVVQETMMEAWRHVEQLRDPQRFHAWLDGICRNVCRRHQTAEGALRLHESLSMLDHDETTNDAGASPALPDPAAIDPAEELSRRDLSVLLDRALGYLASDTRKILELCYLAEIPQREVALQMGLTVGALELRLHRARKQLRQVLSGALRADAESFGLTLDTMQVQGWRETREWCWMCGKQRMLGNFESLPDGHVALRMRCPACFKQYGFDVINSGGLVPMEGLHSFRPAIKRLYQQIRERLWLPLTRGTCFQCHGPVLVSIIDSGDVSFPVPPDHYWIRAECPKCGTSFPSEISSILASHPVVAEFLLQHERCVLEPHRLLEHDGRAVICVGIADVLSAEQLTLLLDVHTLQLIAAL